MNSLSLGQRRPPVCHDTIYQKAEQGGADGQTKMSITRTELNKKSSTDGKWSFQLTPTVFPFPGHITSLKLQPPSHSPLENTTERSHGGSKFTFSQKVTLATSHFPQRLLGKWALIFFFICSPKQKKKQNKNTLGEKQQDESIPRNSWPGEAPSLCPATKSNNVQYKSEL